MTKKAEEELLKAVESGELNASDILAELAADAEKAQDTNQTIKTETPVSKDKLPEEVQAGIAEGEAADADRPESEKLQDKADDLTETIENLTDDAEKLKADAIAEVNKDASITDKEKAIADKKVEIGKEAILDSVEQGYLSAKDVLKEFENDYNTRNKAPKKEASKSIVKKLTDIADDLADTGEKAKAVEEKTAALNKQNETLEKAKVALETAKNNKADQDVIDKLQDAVTKLEGSVASAKTAADEAKAEFDKVDEVVKAYKDAIDKLTDEYNGYVEAVKVLKENDSAKVEEKDLPKDFSGGVNDAEATTEPAKEADEVPTVPNAPEFNGGVNPSDSPSGDNESDFNGGVNDTTPPTVADAPEYTGGVNSVEAAINEVPQYTLTTAGTNKDNTYQAPAVKTEDKKELPNTGGKDNVAVASLGFLGLFLGALPFVKRKN